MIPDDVSPEQSTQTLCFRNCPTLKAAKRDREARRLYAALDLGVGADPLDSSMAVALAELGRLATLSERTDGLWGELAARLCGVLGAEKCALIEELEGTIRTVCARGGGSEWVAAVESLIRTRRPVEPEELAAPDLEEEAGTPGKLVIVPYASVRLNRRRWASLENRHSRPLVSASDTRVMGALAAQLGVLLENFALWRELNEARRRLEQENRYYRRSDAAPARGERIVGDSPALRRTLDLVARVAPVTTSVLVLGETV